jgi:hypothetical protein
MYVSSDIYKEFGLAEIYVHFSYNVNIEDSFGDIIMSFSVVGYLRKFWKLL